MLETHSGAHFLADLRPRSGPQAMPHTSQRRQELDNLCDAKEKLVAEWLLLKRSILLLELFDDVENCSFLELKHLRLQHVNLLLRQIRDEEESIESKRYLSRPSYRSISSDNMFDRLVFSYDVPHFRQMARMDFSTFLQVVAMIQDHPIFHTDDACYKKQWKVWQQALVCFERLGCNGNGASVGRFAREFGIGVGTVVLYTARVVKALLSLEHQHLAWPDEEEQSAISARMAVRGFPGCVGFVDGTYAVLRYCPTRDGETFFNRKSRYVYNLLLVCDDLKRIRYVVSGWPGSVHDSTIWKSSPIGDEPERFFRSDKYVLADSAYALDRHIIPVYRQPAATNERNKRFNELVAT